MRRPRLVACAAILASAVAASGCGVRPTGTLSAGTNPVVGGQDTTVTVYLLRGERLVPVARPGLAGHPYLGVVQLGVPLLAAEERKGLRTEVPRQDGLGVSPAGSGRIEVSVEPGEGELTRAGIAQLVCTGQAVPGVRQVRVEGLDFDRRATGWLTCGRFSDLGG